MTLTFDPTDGAYGMLLVRLGRRELGYINRPPELRGRWRAYTIGGEALPGEHRIRLGAAMACRCWAERGRREWGCDSEAAIIAFDRELGRTAPANPAEHRSVPYRLRKLADNCRLVLEPPGRTMTLIGASPTAKTDSSRT